MECDTHEAPALNLLALHLQLESAVGEIDIRQVRRALDVSFAQANTFSGTVA